MPRPKADHEERRARLAKAACEVILDIGLENAKLSDIGTRAGLTTGAVQHYFRSKEDLLFFAKNHVFDLILDKTRTPPPELEGAERLYYIIRRHLPITTEHLKAVRLLEAFRGRAIGNATLLRNQHKRDLTFLSLLEEELGRLRAAGLMRTDMPIPAAALGLNAIIEGIGCIVMAAPGAYKSINLFTIVADYITGVLGVPPPLDSAAKPARQGKKARAEAPPEKKPKTKKTSPATPSLPE